MISKDMFVGIIANINKQQEKAEDFTKALDIYCDGYPIFDVDNLYLKSLLDILREIFHDEGDYIGWWLWEDVEKKVWEYDKNGNEIENDVSTPELLYDFLIKNMKAK